MIAGMMRNIAYNVRSGLTSARNQRQAAQIKAFNFPNAGDEIYIILKFVTLYILPRNEPLLRQDRQSSICKIGIRQKDARNLRTLQLLLILRLNIF